MKRWQMRPEHYVLAAFISFLIAAINFSGLVLRDDVPGRIIVGAVWSVVGIGWSSRYYYVRLRAREREVLKLREGLLAQARDAAAQQERNRLARELHDSIKQQIFSISMSTAAVEARWDTDPQGAREALDNARHSAQEAMAEMNALLQQLSPAPLEKVGLVQALRDQCEALSYRTDAEVNSEFSELPADDWLPTGAQESIFRIAQEAFSNIARHARAEHVRLYLGQRDADGPLMLEIQDDGQGFSADKGTKGMGLENIRQRVRALGGRLTLDSSPGQGTTVRVIIPLVEPIAYEEETIHVQNHTLNKVFLTGLGGGIALSAALFYPLYVLVPGQHVAGWPSGWDLGGLVLEIAAALLAAATGFLAARWTKAPTRQAGTLSGALAGGVAGAALFFGLGAPTSAVVGGTALLARGLIPAASKAEAIRLLAESAVGIVWWTHGAFWAALAGGVGLGAVGGLLAPPSTERFHRLDLRLSAQTVLTPAVIVSAFFFLYAITGFALIEPTIHTGLAMNGVSLKTPLLLECISDWLIGTPLLLYLASLVALYLLLRAEIKNTQDPARLSAARSTATLLTFISFGVPVYLGVIGSPALPKGGTVLPRGWMDITGLYHPSPASIGVAVGALLSILGLVSSLVMGGLYLLAMKTAYRRQRALELPSSHPIRAVVLISAPLSLGIIDWATSLPSVWCALVGLVLIAVGVALIVNLLRLPKQPQSSPSYAVAIISVLLSPAIMGLTVNLSPFWVVLVGLVIIIANIALIVNLLRLSKQSLSHTITLAQLRLMISQAVNAGLGSVVAMTIPPMTVISTIVGIGLITNKLTEVLIGYQAAASEFTLVELVRNVYLTQARACLITFVVAAAVVGLLTLIISGIMAIPEQLAAQSAQEMRGIEP